MARSQQINAKAASILEAAFFATVLQVAISPLP